MVLVYYNWLLKVDNFYHKNFYIWWKTIAYEMEICYPIFCLNIWQLFYLKIQESSEDEIKSVLPLHLSY